MKYLLPCLLITATTFAQPITSRLETFDIRTNERRVVHTDTVRFEAPNWTRDGRAFIINQQGRVYRVDAATGQKTLIDTRPAERCNNDHGISPDGKTLVISHDADDLATGKRLSTIYLVPITGGIPRVVTVNNPSYWHGWSPDGQTLAYVGERELPDGTRDYDIYTIPAKNGRTAQEKRLTTSRGLDDGPDYSPDGKHIYFNSMRTGKMQIWRMNADGNDPMQLTNDAQNNWFPHPSPDGRHVVFLTYLDDIPAHTHPADKNVALRLMDLQTGQTRELARFRGGQGTINVPSWSPDGRRFAFVSY